MGWPFLIARGRERGYRLVLVPSSFSEPSDGNRVEMGASGRELRVGGPPICATVTLLDGPAGVVYQARRLTVGDLVEGSEDGTIRHSWPAGPESTRDGARDELVRDAASRPLDPVFGFVVPGGRVTVPADGDLERAWHRCVAAYRSFLASECSFAAERSDPFGLASSVQPYPARKSEEIVRAPAAESARDTAVRVAGGGNGAHFGRVAAGILAACAAALALFMLLRPGASAPRYPSTVDCGTVPAGQTVDCTVDVSAWESEHAIIDNVEIRSLPDGGAAASGNWWVVQGCHGTTVGSGGCRIVVSFEEGRAQSDPYIGELRIRTDNPRVDIRLRLYARVR